MSHTTIFLEFNVIAVGLETIGGFFTELELDNLISITVAHQNGGFPIGIRAHLRITPAVDSVNG